MARKAIQVDDDCGVYQIHLGAEAESYCQLHKRARNITIIEHLIGWGPWKWAISIDDEIEGPITATHFIDGEAEPRECRYI